MDNNVKAGRSEVCLPFGPLLQGKYLARPNRFVVEVEVDDTTVTAHLADPGRLEELLIPGRPVWLRAAQGTNRKTSHDLTLLELPHTWVSMSTQLPNRLVAQILADGVLQGFERGARVRREVRFGSSRIDFCLDEAAGRRHWVEVKSVNLRQGVTAAFPDAPTDRGRRHVHELMDAVAQGDRATILFVAQRDDVEAFAPCDAIDPDFGAALRQAAQAGVTLRAVRCKASPEKICLDREIPVLLDAAPSDAIIAAEV